MPRFALARKVDEDLLIEAPDFETAKRVAAGEDIDGCEIVDASLNGPEGPEDVLEMTEPESLEIASQWGRVATD